MFLDDDAPAFPPRGRRVRGARGRPASAHPSLDDLKPCYVAAQEEQRESVADRRQRFTPTKYVDIYIDEIAAASEPPTASFDGEICGSVNAPFIEEGERPFTLRATERDNLASTPSRRSRV